MSAVPHRRSPSRFLEAVARRVLFTPTTMHLITLAADIEFTIDTFSRDRVSFEDLINVAIRWRLSDDWPAADGFDNEGYPWFYRATASRWWQQQVEGKYNGR